LKTTIGVIVLALCAAYPAHAREEGERTYRCTRLVEARAGGILAIRMNVYAHNQAEAIALCEINFDKRLLYMPEEARPTAIAQSDNK
jgi:hypothetical protein